MIERLERTDQSGMAHRLRPVGPDEEVIRDTGELSPDDALVAIAQFVQIADAEAVEITFPSGSYSRKAVVPIGSMPEVLN